MTYTNFVRGLVRKHPELKTKLKKAGDVKTPFQFMHQTLIMTTFSSILLFVIIYLILKNNIIFLAIGIIIAIILIPLIFRFWLGYVDVQIRKYARELDDDILFISEYFLVSIESGLPLGNSIKRLSRLKRAGGTFFKGVYNDFNTGKDLEQALGDASFYCPSEDLKILLKKLKDSLDIGIDLRLILNNFIIESSEKKVIEVKNYAKKLNPLIMIYLIMGVVVPSLGITFFILTATILEITPTFLRLILTFVFLLMFGFQYGAYSLFKFSRATV